jgi:hypothetical protein
MLIKNGYHTAAKLVEDKFKERHGIEFKNKYGNLSTNQNEIVII